MDPTAIPAPLPNLGAILHPDDLPQPVPLPMGQLVGTDGHHRIQDIYSLDHRRCILEIYLGRMDPCTDHRCRLALGIFFWNKGLA